MATRDRPRDGVRFAYPQFLAAYELLERRIQDFDSLVLAKCPRELQQAWKKTLTALQGFSDLAWGLYNGLMGPERGRGRPREHKDTTNLYDLLRERLPLDGIRPLSIHVDQEGNPYLSLEEAAKFAGLSIGRLRDLIYTDRLVGRKLGGPANFIDLFSLVDYIDHGRKRPGPKPR